VTAPSAGVALLAAAVGVLLGAALVLVVARLRTPSTAPVPAGRPVAAPPAVTPPWLGDVLDVLRGGAVVLDPDDEVLLANPAARTLGLVRGRRLAVPELARLAQESRADGERRVVEVHLTRRGRLPAGTAVRARITPLSDGGHVAVLAEDVSEARRVDAVRRDFVANVSHELKTPVGAMALLAEALLDGADDPEAVRRFASRVQHESARLTRLVQELIDLSRL
jgi:two-component system, OmpR family, sensor histidine kinase SenX3